MLSVVCPIYNEEKYISKCIDSLLQQKYPKNNLEILFVDGMSIDRTRDIVQDYSIKYPFIRLINNPFRIVPYAMNIGITSAKGDVIVRIDAHCEYPNNYLYELEKNLLTLENAENVGGICETLPCNNSASAIGIAIALSSPFGMGNSHFRIGADKVMKVDTVPFGCFRRDIFYKIGLYDTDLIRNQDDELNGRIIKYGGTIYLIPSLKIKYYARDSILKIRKMFYEYGLFKPLVNKKLGHPTTIRQFFPLVFLLCIVLGSLLSIFSKWILYSFISILLIYGIIAISISFKSAKEYKQISLIVLLPFIFLNIHLSYACGYIGTVVKR